MPKRPLVPAPRKYIFEPEAKVSVNNSIAFDIFLEFLVRISLILRSSSIKESTI